MNQKPSRSIKMLVELSRPESPKNESEWDGGSRRNEGNG